MLIESLWRDKYATLKEYYLDKFSNEDYCFDDLQYEIDPDETIENFEMYDEKKQELELSRCKESFAYFCHKYIKIKTLEGIIPFILYKYQNRVVKEIDENQFNILLKFRQGGFTNLNIFRAMHKCLFAKDVKFLFLSKTDREATDIGKFVDAALKTMPSWMNKKTECKSEIKTINDNCIYFKSPHNLRGLRFSDLVIDEAAYFFEEKLKEIVEMFPYDENTNCLLVSTIYHNTFFNTLLHESKNNLNKFNYIKVNYTEHPIYKDPKWVEETKKMIGERLFKQEILSEI